MGDKVKALREQAYENGSKIKQSSSDGVDLAEAIARVSAPTLTFDWRLEHSWSDDSESASAGLEVEMPWNDRDATASDATARRKFLREELDRTISISRLQDLIAERQRSEPSAAVGEQQQLQGCTQAL